MDLSQFDEVSAIAGDLCYVGLAAVALWGLFCVVLVWRRISELRFRNEADQAQYLARMEDHLLADDFDGAVELCRDDPRAVPQLALLGITHREMPHNRLRHLLADRFQRDVLADLEYRLSWVYTVIKTAPMLGLFGTVLGMMSAFGKLSGEKVDPTGLADDISLALITTALGLAIAIPLTLAVASLNIRIRKLEDLVGLGLTRLLDMLHGRHGGDVPSTMIPPTTAATWKDE